MERQGGETEKRVLWLGGRRGGRLKLLKENLREGDGKKRAKKHASGVGLRSLSGEVLPGKDGRDAAQFSGCCEN